MINNLEILDTDSNYSNDDQLTDTSYASISTSENDSDNFINLGCQDSCCKNINVLKKDEPIDNLLFEAITHIEDPEQRKEFLLKYKKQILELTPQDVINKGKSACSLSEALKTFNKQKSKEVTIQDLHAEIKNIKTEIKELKTENHLINQRLGSIKEHRQIEVKAECSRQREPIRIIENEDGVMVTEDPL